MRKERSCSACGRVCYGSMCMTCYKGARTRKIISMIEREINMENEMKRCVEAFKRDHPKEKYTNKELLQALIVKVEHNTNYICDMLKDIRNDS